VKKCPTCNVDLLKSDIICKSCGELVHDVSEELIHDVKPHIDNVNSLNNINNSNLPNGVEYPRILVRYLASVIDGTLLIACFLIWAYIVERWEPIMRIVGGISIVLFCLIYEPCFTSKLCTVGQKIMGIRVRDLRTMGKVSLPNAYFRFFIKFLLGLISFVTIPVTKGRRGIHDFAGNSIVITAKTLEISKK
jgi:uncharacterized RDD family membrane protein YckC